MSTPLGLRTPKLLYKIERARDKHEKLKLKGDLIPGKKWNIFRGDTVQIIREHPYSKFYKQLGKTGVVTRVLRKKNMLIVKGMHLRKRFTQPTQSSTGSSYLTESPIHYSA